MNIKVIMLKDMDWIHLAQERDQWQALLSSNEPSHSTKYREFSE
jgi:hypothetical protein